MIVERIDVSRDDNCEPRKLNNKELSEFFFAHLKDLGYTVRNCKKLDSYYVFESEDSSIFNFEIKEIPGFLFGLWKADLINMGYPEDTDYILFAQPILTIDKFKPSRSGLRVRVSRLTFLPNDSDYWVEEWADYYVISMLDFMKKNKTKCHYYGDLSDVDIFDSVSYLYALKYRVETTLRYFKLDIKEKYKLRRGIKFSRKYLKKVLKGHHYNATLFDYNGGYTPRLYLGLYSHEDVAYTLVDIDLLYFNYNVDVKWFETKAMYIDNIKTLEKDRGCKKIWKV